MHALAQALVIAKGAEVDDGVAAEIQAPRPAAGGEERALESVGLPAVVERHVARRVEPDDPASQERVDPGGRRAPDAVDAISLPQALRERRPDRKSVV